MMAAISRGPRTPRGKLLAAGALLAVLAAGPIVAAAGQGTAGRVGLGLGLSALAAGWIWQGRGPGARAAQEPTRLQVQARAGLSPRCSLALVEADGQQFLVVHGDGFATIRQTRAPKAPRPPMARRPRSKPASGVLR